MLLLLAPLLSSPPLGEDVIKECLLLLLPSLPLGVSTPPLTSPLAAPPGYRTDGRGDLVFRRMGYVARLPSRRRLFRYPFSLGAKELFVDPNILAHTKLSALKKCARG